jgi:TPR repeat protein
MVKAMDIKWEIEPDIDALRGAYSLLSTDAGECVKRLEALAGHGSVMSMVYLGHIFSGGTQMTRDWPRAEKWYLEAQKHGSYIAQFNLGAHYYNNKEFDRAKSIFKIGADKNDGPSMHYLACVFLREGTKESLNTAYSLLDRASTIGHLRSRLLYSKLMLGGRFGLLAIGRGVPIFVHAAIDAIRGALTTPSDELLR